MTMKNKKVKLRLQSKARRLRERQGDYRSKLL